MKCHQPTTYIAASIFRFQLSALNEQYGTQCTNHISYTYMLYDAMGNITFIRIVVYMLIYYEFEIINQSHSCKICCVSNLTRYHTRVFILCERQFHYHLPFYRLISIHCISYSAIRELLMNKHIFRTIFVRIHLWILLLLLSLHSTYTHTSYCQFIESGTLMHGKKDRITELIGQF